jgi:hypothetical protein
MEDIGGMTELVTLRTLAQKANLTPEARHTALWCLDQLPPLYRDFSRTNESRFGDSISFLAKVALKRLGEAEMGPDAGRVAAALVAQLAGLHERLGLAPLGLKITAPPLGGPVKKRASRKAVALPNAVK